MLTATQLHKGDKQCVIVNAEAKTKPQKMRSQKPLYVIKTAIVENKSGL